MKTYLIKNGVEVYKYTETKELSLRDWMINNIDQSKEWEVYIDYVDSKISTLDMIKRLCEYRSETFKKVLCYEFLEDINYHPEAEQIYDTFSDRYNFMSNLDLLSQKSNRDLKTWEYFEETYTLSKYQKALDMLLTQEGNFRVATHPDDFHLTIGYEAFRDFQDAQKKYSAISNLSEYGCENGEADMIIEFALTPNED